MKTQKQIVLEYLLRGKRLSQRGAIVNWSIIRLSSIIHILRNEGFPIITDYQPNLYRTGSYGEYYISQDVIETFKAKLPDFL